MAEDIHLLDSKNLSQIFDWLQNLDFQGTYMSGNLMFLHPMKEELSHKCSDKYLFFSDNALGIWKWASKYI